MLRLALTTLLLTLAIVHHAGAQPAVFVVRHAERADAGTTGASMMKDDPELSPAGRARAQALARLLRDTGIRTIYTTELKRSQHTAAPLAEALGAKTVTVAANDVDALLEKVRAETGDVLIVGHSNTIPQILSGLGAPGTVTVAENEYDNLFIVLRGTPARFLRLRFP
jgi:broad specificity phosphatase PhoE